MKTQSSWLALLASLLLWTPATVAEEQSLSLLLLPPISGEGSAQLAISWQGAESGRLELRAIDARGESRPIASRELEPGMHLEGVAPVDGDMTLVAVLRDAKGRELARADHPVDSGAWPPPAQFSRENTDISTQTTSSPPTSAKGSVVDWKAMFGGNAGPDGRVRAMTVYDDGSGPALVIGGEFVTAGGLVVNGLARWNGTSWSGIGSDGGLGVGGSVLALTAVGADLYIGGGFREVNLGGPTVNANCIARWDGRQWSALGSGDNNGLGGPVGCVVFAIAAMGMDVYVGGRFREAGVGGSAIQANGIARWSPTTSTWSSLGSGVATPDHSWVNALVVLDGNLYAGGYVEEIGGALGSIARWNGTSWSALSGGPGWGGSVNALAVLGGDVYAAGGVRVARWNRDTAAWVSIGSGGGDSVGTGFAQVHSLLAVGDTLYVGGSFWEVDPGGSAVRAGNIARWRPATATWSGLGSITGVGFRNGITADVRAMAALDGHIHVGGSFSRAYVGAEEIDVRNAAAWNLSTSSWTGLGDTASLFNRAGTGETWVHAVAVLGNDLYIGGSFTRLTHAGTSIEVNGIARWNGSTWSSLGSAGGSGVEGGAAPRVSALATLAGDLYVGGWFTQVNSGGVTVNANGIARWSPTTSTWSVVGSGAGNGVAGTVRALATQGQSLFVGGSFSRANAGGLEVGASNVARWNGSSWSSVGSDGGNGVSGQVNALALVGPELYVGGYFQQANVGGREVSVNNLARWNGSQWNRVGDGGGGGLGHPNGWTRAGVWALAASGDDLYAGGEFFWANEGGTVVPANQIARWDGIRWHSLGSGGGNGVFVSPFSDPSVYALTVIGGDLYVGGFFLQANAGGPAVAANNIARWDGSSWSSVGSGQNGISRSVLALGAYGNDLIAGGSHGRAGSVATSNLAAFGIADTSSATISSTVPAPSAPGEPVRIRVLVSASTAPTSGHVTVTGAPGGSCSDLALTAINATTSEAECTIRWNTTGAQLLTARYTGGSSAASTWQPSRSAPFSHTVAPLFSDGFEQSP